MGEIFPDALGRSTSLIELDIVIPLTISTVLFRSTFLGLVDADRTATGGNIEELSLCLEDVEVRLGTLLTVGFKSVLILDITSIYSIWAAFGKGTFHIYEVDLEPSGL